MSDTTIEQKSIEWPQVTSSILTFVIVGISLIVTYDSGYRLVVFQLVALLVTSMLIGRMLVRESARDMFESFVFLCLSVSTIVMVVVSASAGESSGALSGILTSLMAVLSVWSVIYNKYAACAYEHASYIAEWDDVISLYTCLGVFLFVFLLVLYGILVW